MNKDGQDKQDASTDDSEPRMNTDGHGCSGSAIKADEYMYRDIEDLEDALGFEVNEAVKQGFEFARMKWGMLPGFRGENAEAGRTEPARFGQESGCEDARS